MLALRQLMAKTSSENLLGGVIIGVHSSREVDAGFGCWWSQINCYAFGIC